MNLIVAYDITCPRRIEKVAKILKDYGVRVQKSIFEVTLNPTLFVEMKARIEEVIEAASDGVKYFPVCERCAGTLEIIGQGQYTDPDEEYYIL